MGTMQSEVPPDVHTVFSIVCVCAQVSVSSVRSSPTFTRNTFTFLNRWAAAITIKASPSPQAMATPTYTTFVSLDESISLIITVSRVPFEPSRQGHRKT